MSMGNSPAERAIGKQHSERLMAKADADRAARLAGTNRSSGSCSNACGRTGSNRSAIRSPSLQIRRFLCGHPDPFRSIRDLGCVPASCSCSSGDLPTCGVYEAAMLPARDLPGTPLSDCSPGGCPSISPGQNKFSEVRAEGVGFEPTVTLPPQ